MIRSPHVPAALALASLVLLAAPAASAQAVMGAPQELWTDTETVQIAQFELAQCGPGQAEDTFEYTYTQGTTSTWSQGASATISQSLDLKLTDELLELGLGVEVSGTQTKGQGGGTTHATTVSAKVTIAVEDCESETATLTQEVTETLYLIVVYQWEAGPDGTRELVFDTNFVVKVATYGPIKDTRNSGTCGVCKTIETPPGGGPTDGGEEPIEPKDPVVDTGNGGPKSAHGKGSTSPSLPPDGATSTGELSLGWCGGCGEAPFASHRIVLQPAPAAGLAAYQLHVAGFSEPGAAVYVSFVGTWGPPQLHAVYADAYGTFRVDGEVVAEGLYAVELFGDAPIGPVFVE